MTKTRKALFLSFGVAVGFAGLVAASERERGSDAAATESSAYAPEHQALRDKATDGKLVSPGVAVATVNGKQVEYHLNSAVISIAEAEKQAGSVDKFIYERTMQNVPYFLGKEGEKIYAAPFVGNFPDSLTPAQAAAVKAVPQQQEAKAPTMDDFKASHRWVEVTTNGHTQVIFQSAIIPNDPALIPSTAISLQNNGVPSFTYNGRKIYASPVVSKDEASDGGSN